MILRRTLPALGLALAFAIPASAAPEVQTPSGAYRLALDHSAIVFRVKHLGLANFTARFTRFTADLGFDAAHPEASTLSVAIDAKSVQTAVPRTEKLDFDNQLATEAGLLNANAFPQITYVAKKIVRTGPDKARIEGELTLLGVTKPVTLSAIFNGSLKAHPYTRKPIMGFSATGSVKRSDFGMTAYTPMVGDQVDMLIDAEFVPK